MTSFKKAIYTIVAGSIAASVITLAYSQGAVTQVQTWLNGKLVSSTNPLPNSVTGPTGIAAQVNLDGMLSVAPVPYPQFTDTFSAAALDITNNWTTNNSSGTTTVSGSVLTIAGTTTASQYAGLSTKQSWIANGTGYQVFGASVAFNTLVVTNSVRIFGSYTSPATPTLAAPITNGYVFRFDATGALFAEIWAAGSAVSSTNITAVAGCAPVANTYNTYYIQYRTNVVAFGCGSNSQAAVIQWINPGSNLLPISAYSIAGLSNPGSAAQILIDQITLVTGNGPAIKSGGQAVSPNDPAMAITSSNNTPFGELPVMPTPQNLFKDTFDTSFDTTNNWNAATAAGGGVTVAQSPGQITLGTGTTPNGYAYTTSKPSFGLVEPGFVVTTVTLMVPTAIPTNSYAAWGGFTPAAVPTAAIPITEGCGFELQPNAVIGAGKMYVVCYAASTRTVIQDLSAATGNGRQPTDGHTHSYYQFTAGGQFYWSIDGTLAANIVAVQTSGINGPNVNTQPAALLAVAGTSAPGSSLTLTVAAVWVAVTNTNGWIADGVYPYRKATVKPAATAATTADLPLVVALSPSVASLAPVVSGSAVSGLVLKNAPGNLGSAYAVCTAACWLMIFNAVAVPSNGATTAGIASGNMQECIPIASGGIGSVSYLGGSYSAYSVGISAAISSTSCATLTLATTGFIHGVIQ
jgi:hypothetical protein